ncbi:hypothetical protein KCP75_12805 [Salmonella enterica subsp. enterica]|nr:hypothetical protein KCP75_12805 [Salmonella enterica subsp. enterica]
MASSRKSCLMRFRCSVTTPALALRQSCLVWPNSFWFGIPATRGEQGFIGAQGLGSASCHRPGGAV